jgi:Di-haem cytochrome c peroxidase
VTVGLIQSDYLRADVLGGPLPSPRLPPDAIHLTAVEKLGKLMLYDSTLSNPPVYSCATCHVPEAGFTGPNSEINGFAGPQPGVVPGRFNDRKPQSYLYAAFSPEGPFYDPHLQVWLGGNFWDGRVPDLSKQGLQPPINPNEMANTPEGPYPPTSGGGIRRSWFRSSRTGRIPRYSSRSTVRMSFKSTSPNKSTKSSARPSLHTNPQERSARSVRSTIPRNMGRRRETFKHSPRPRNAGGNCTSARPNALRATPPRQSPPFK